MRRTIRWRHPVAPPESVFFCVLSVACTGNSTPSGFTWANANRVVGDFNGDACADTIAFYDLGVPTPYHLHAIGA